MSSWASLWMTTWVDLNMLCTQQKGVDWWFISWEELSKKWTFAVVCTQLKSFLGQCRTSFKQDVDIFESIQKSATCLLYGSARPSYSDRLRVFGMSTFEKRRMRGDLMITYRLIRGFLNSASAECKQPHRSRFWAEIGYLSYCTTTGIPFE